MDKRGKINSLVSSIIVRYLLLLLFAFPNLFLFYAVFTPLTLYPVYFLLNLFFDASISGNTILVKCFSINLIQACIAGSAYYLFLILNLATPEIRLKKRISLVLSSFFIFLMLNILRIFVLSLLAIFGSDFFNPLHKLFWYSLSVIFVVGIWFAGVKLFRIKEIPFYSDIRFLFHLSSTKTNKKRKLKIK